MNITYSHKKENPKKNVIVRYKASPNTKISYHKSLNSMIVSLTQFSHVILKVFTGDQLPGSQEGLNHRGKLSGKMRHSQLEIKAVWAPLCLQQLILKNIFITWHS